MKYKIRYVAWYMDSINILQMVYFMAEGFFFTPVNQKEMSSFKLQFDLIQILTFPSLYLKKQLTYRMSRNK